MNTDGFDSRPVDDSQETAGGSPAGVPVGHAGVRVEIDEVRAWSTSGFLALLGGVVAGFPVIDLKATLIDGSFHEVDSSEMAFKIAGSMAAKDGVSKADPAILEPVMKVEVVTPEDYLGDVIGDLNSRRGQIQGTDSRGNAQVVEAMVPLANMFGYVNQLRSFSQGRATFTMQFDHYEQVPASEAAKVQAKYA